MSLGQFAAFAIVGVPLYGRMRGWTRLGRGTFWLALLSLGPALFACDMLAWASFVQWLNRPRPLPSRH